MIDNSTIKIPVTNTKWLKSNFDWSQTANAQTKDVYAYTAHLNGLRLKLKEDKLTISNSIHKYYKGNNYTDFSYTEVKDAFSKLSNDLETDLNKALIPKFEFGINLLVENTPNYYLDQIEAFKPKSIVPLDSSNRRSNLYYDTERLRTKIYNKTTESSLSYNMLRLEVTRKSSSKYLAHIQTIEDLLNQNNYITLKDELLNQFNKFQFKESFDFSEITSANELYRILAIQNSGLLNTQNILKASLKAKTYEYQKAQINKQIEKYKLPNTYNIYLKNIINQVLELS